jgi:hypothetical protein
MTMLDEIVFLPGFVDEGGNYIEREGSVYGVLAVRNSTPDYSEPVMRICDYPILLRAHRERCAHLIGKQVRYDYDGRYIVDVETRVTLLNGGQTKAIHRTSYPIPAPKTRARTRYQYGRWEKYLAREGWVPA